MRNLIPSILGLTTVFLLVAGIFIGASTFNSESQTKYVSDDGEQITDIPTEESVVTEDGEHNTEAIVPTTENPEDLEIAENYDEILANSEEMEYRQEIANEVSAELPHEYINPNALAGREHVLTETDFDCYDEYMEWYIANQDRPFDIDGYFTDVPDYEPIIDPNANIIVVEGIAFDHEGTVLSKEEAEQIDVETEGEYNE